MSLFSPVSQTSSINVDHPVEGKERQDDIKLQESGRMIEERFLQKEIIHSFSKFRLHNTESGERVHVQSKFLINLKIARMRDVILKLESTKGRSDGQPTIENIISAMRRLTEISTRRRMVLWFNYRHCSFIQQLTARALSLVEKFTSHEAVVMIWLVGKIGRRAYKRVQEGNPTKALLTHLVRGLLKRGNLAQMPPHDALLLVNGLANLDCIRLPEILDACLPIFLNALSSLEHDQFALFVWSYGKLGYLPSDVTFERAVGGETEKRIDQLSVQQLSSVVWGMARTNVTSASTFLLTSLDRVEDAIEEYVPVGIARLMDACYLLNHHPKGNVVWTLSNRFAHFRGYSTPLLLQQALPAFAYFTGFNKSLFEYSLYSITDRYTSLTESDQMIRILTAYSVSDFLSPTFLEMTIAKLLVEDSYTHLPVTILRELWIGIISHRAHYGEGVDRAVPRKLMMMVKTAWHENESKKEANPIAQEIQQIFNSENVSTSCSYLEPLALVHADLICQWKQQRVALFVVDDGDSVSNDDRRVNGHFLWRERLFLKLGYGTARVEAKRWQSIVTPTVRRRYLLHIVKNYTSTERKSYDRETLMKLQGRFLNVPIARDQTPSTQLHPTI